MQRFDCAVPDSNLSALAAQTAIRALNETGCEGMNRWKNQVKFTLCPLVAQQYGGTGNRRGRVGNE